MNAPAITIVLIAALFLISINDAYVLKRKSSNAPIEIQMYEYLQVVKQENLISQRRKQLENELLERLNEKSTSNDNNDDDYGRLLVRRKVVGLGDNPFK
ncbi:unnamed protein product [Adineta ricciae]|uniref:Uncharacterized protein n=1 Tax=Adineta ricciae TaxID=249248 RepID=A0A816BYS4_ADIRI|nr:unnamed protein product [Adineta ricciae]